MTMTAPLRAQRLLGALAATLTLLACLWHGAPAMAEEDPALDQTVSATEEVASGQAVVEAGHVDLGPRKGPDDAWQLLARDDSGSTPVWRRLTDLVIRVPNAALMEAPTGEEFDFMGERAGQRWYVIPQVEAAGVPWLGWNTQDPGVVEDIDRGVTMRVHPATGPGRAVMFLQDGTFGKPLVLADSSKEETAKLWVDVNTHVHANWVFTEPGVYLIPLEFSGQAKDGSQRSTTATLRLAVGDSTDPAQALAATEPSATPEGADDGASPSAPALTEAGAGSGQDAAARGSGSGGLTQVVWWAVGLGAACLLGALAFWRRTRRVAAQIEAARTEVTGSGVGVPGAASAGAPEGAVTSDGGREA